MRKLRYFILVLFGSITLSTLLSSCGVLENDNGCVLIKKQSLEMRDLGYAFIEKMREGKVGEGVTPEQIQKQGVEYIIEGTKLVVDNPRCFPKEDVSAAKNLLGY